MDNVAVERIIRARFLSRTTSFSSLPQEQEPWAIYSVSTYNEVSNPEKGYDINVLKIFHNYSSVDQYEARLASRRQLSLTTWEAKRRRIW
jgi:hypothetical protein